MSYTHLTSQERYVISHLNVAKFSLREIARRLGRHHTTISREIKRNGPAYTGGVYWYYFIERGIQEKRHHPRCHRRQNHAPLVDYVEDKLREDWPPEVIAHALRTDFPHDERMRVSHETIYRWVSLDAEQGGNLHQHLRRRHKYRRRQKRYGAGRRFIPGGVGIEERPKIVAERSRVGDWEADSRNWKPRQSWPSISLTPIRPGSAERTRTPTACCGSIFPRGRTSDASQKRP